MKGTVIVPREARINVKGGTLRLVKGSELLLENNNGNTNLDLQSGITELYQDSKIIIQQGAKMTIQAFSVLNLNDESQIIVKNGGILNIEGGTQNLIGTSKIIVETGGTVYFNSALTMSQNAMVELQKQVNCSAGNAATINQSGSSRFLVGERNRLT